MRVCDEVFICVGGVKSFCAMENDGERFELGQNLEIKTCDGETIIGNLFYIGCDFVIIVTRRNPVPTIKVEDIKEAKHLPEKAL